MSFQVSGAAFAAASALLSASAIAQSAPTQSAQAAADSSLDEVVVVANRAPEPLSKIGVSVTVLNEAAIRDSQAIVVADLLAQTPGLTLSRNGGIGQPTSIFIRGAESDQTVVLIDGVQLNDPALPGGGFDFGNLLTGGIARIEILRGSQSTLYGSQAIGGVVNIVTAEARGPFVGGVNLEGGSRDSGYMNAHLGGKSDRLAWEVAGNYLTTSGISAFDQSFGGTEPDGSHIGGGSGTLRYDLTPDIQLDVRGYFTRARASFDGYDTPTGAFGDDSEYGTTDQYLAYGGFTFRSPDVGLTQRLALQLTDTDRRSYDPAIVGPTTETFFGIGRNTRLEYQGTWSGSHGLRAVFGFQHERSTIDTDSPAYDVTPSRLQEHVAINSGYLQIEREFFHALTVTAGVRHDQHEVFGGHTTAQAAAAWTLNSGNTILRASVGQGFKAPALYQLFSAYGNLGLRPEQANSWDAGIEHHAFDRRLLIGATYFSRTSRDLINFFDCTTPSPLCATEPYGYYDNISKASVHGIEFQTALSPISGLTLGGNFTYTATEDRSVGAATYGNELPRRPRTAANASVSYRWPFGLDASVAARYSGRTFDDAANTIALSSYAVIDLRATYSIGAHMELYGRIENVTDKRYETAYQFGMLTRGVFAGLRATF